MTIKKYYCQNKYCTARDNETEDCSLFDKDKGPSMEKFRWESFVRCEARKLFIKDFCPTEEQLKNIIPITIPETNEEMPF